ncbi:TonB-dependent receptor [Sphingomonas sp. LY54]|uniref:TonB-dependent receptor n=1 Tax=Sphingomonas sp. LY54 TaxID=3095343 RepID=UPI002D765E1D|nr:TonB-dependent receptor [Sphingomonas sp. LY54]WRP28264.1 TonB-dependent receptor [Sphingomonas sp. LY54]
MSRLPLALILLAGTSLTPAFAQEVTPVAEEPAQAVDAPAEQAAAEQEAAEEDEYLDEEEGGEPIVVTGQRERGAVLGDIKPDLQLDRRDIRAYGASNLAELLDALAPQTASGRGRGGGRPVVLLNGRRISGFSEIRNLPPEAISRVDIMPEEVALKYGYPADQRVVNFVLRPRFRAVTAEVEGGMATGGGRQSYEADLNILRITNNGRWNIDAEFERDTALFESERDLIQSPPSRPFDLVGNIAGTPLGSEIDPALSAALGQLVTVAGVPVSAAGGAPALSAFSATPNVTDDGRFRTLLPETDAFSVAGTINRTIFGDVNATLNARYEQTLSKSRFGLPSGVLTIGADNPFSPFGTDVALYRFVEGPRPLTRESDSRTAHVGAALNGDFLPWRWSFTANYDRVRNLVHTDTNLDFTGVQERIDADDPALNPFGPFPGLGFGPRDRSRSVNESANAEFVTNGPIADLPAGDITASLKLGGELRGFDSETMRGGFEQIRDLSRNRVNGQASFDIPIARRNRDVLAAIGDLSANANFAVDHLSDFGTLKTYGFGLNWSPVRALRVIASFTQEEGAPGIQQLGDPVSVVPNVRVFDFTRGETVDVNRIEGGNPDLLADNRRVMKLGFNLRPFSETDLTLNADYNRSRIRNPIAGFPTATPEIEAAFPERFVRGGDGRLLQIDSRPVNFARSDREEIRWGINFSKPIASRGGGGGGFGGGRGGWRQRGEAGAGASPAGQVPPQGTPPADGQTPPATPPERAAAAPGEGRAGPGGPGGGRGFGGRGGQGQGGRLQFSLYHTWRLQDQILIRDGVPELDLLNGSATGNRGGQSEHLIEAQAGISKNGFGARLSANWQSGTSVFDDPGAGASAGALRFSDFTTLNLRLFADLGQQRSLVREYPWLRGTRVTLRVNNLLDSRLQVRDETGATPLSYQPAYLDPLGRSVSLSIRKLFF